MWQIAYDTLTFTGIYNNVDSFKQDYEEFLEFNELENELTTGSIKRTFYLLCSQYANSPIVNYDVMQWKLKLFNIVVEDGGVWQKKVEIQKKLKALDDEEIRIGNKMIYNNALHDESEPSTGTVDELNYINSQSTSGKKKGKVEAYFDLYTMLRTDLNKVYMDKFKGLFSRVVANERPIVYITNEGD